MLVLPILSNVFLSVSQPLSRGICQCKHYHLACSSHICMAFSWYSVLYLFIFVTYQNIHGRIIDKLSLDVSKSVNGYFFCLYVTLWHATCVACTLPPAQWLPEIGTCSPVTQTDKLVQENKKMNGQMESANIV